MVEEPRASFHLLVCIPGVKEITHDHDHIPPALHVLCPALLLNLEQEFVENPLLRMLAQVVASLAVQFVEEIIQFVLILLNQGKVLQADTEALEDFRSEDLQLGAQNASLVAEYGIKVQTW